MVRSLPLNELRKDRTMSIAEAVAAPDMRDMSRMMKETGEPAGEDVPLNS
jgi:hypothetical protein